jgi:hypothetical protein
VTACCLHHTGVIQKFMTRKNESLATMRALTLFKYGTDL